ncbi:glycosyl hydrolase [Nonomuraea sp. PA05]|uniref:beta-glucosidase n=1 Tax=Nonomuraea sp. PA05 TaxID=2604466 RepID=UPI0011D761E4|nr:glycoside hydrolase family 3 C-terminal domain-containing protein [Nonomuraea sp. PA05]TYB71090.1 glycosyl hydrolase [Nonomuraea sp. PA05]
MRLLRLLLPVALAAVVAPPLQPALAAAARDPYPAECPWMNTRKSAGERAALLLAASTPEQRMRWLVEHPANQPSGTTFSGVTYPPQVPCTPNVTYTDGPDSVRGPAGVTTFPAQIGLAASWNADLAFAKGRAQGAEAFGKGRNVVLGPGLASGRTPLSGRTPEYLGEDALLGGTLAAAHVNGLQKGDPERPVMAVLKHYLGNEQELDRQLSSSNMDERTLRQVYDLPFEVTLGGSSPGAVMCSYNQVNGVYACENPMLKEVLKDGFDGYVMSDFGSVHSTGPSVAAGMDQELNRPRFLTPDLLKAAIAAGEISQAQLDAAAFRVVRAYLKAGLFDHPVPAVPAEDVSTPEHKAVSQAIAAQGSVLLKNDPRILPISKRAGRIAVIGPTASNTPTNGVSANTVCGMRGFGAGDCKITPVAPLDAITRRAAAQGATVTFDNGADLASAAATARDADVAIVFGYYTMGEGADRPNLNLDNGGDALIEAVAAANPETVVVLETGSAVLMPWLGRVKAVLEAWYPGDQQGTAIARLLWGDDNPSGRLPMTFPKDVADLPTRTPEQYPGVFADGGTVRPPGDRTSIRQVNYTEGLKVGYKWYDSEGVEPLFPFGHGLSYTSFAYEGLRLDRHRDGFTARFRVRNTGARTGTETAQLYVTLPGRAAEPGRRLAGFEQVTLRPGQSRTIEVKVRADAADHPLSVWDTAAGRWTTVPGTYRVQAGRSSRDLPLSAAVRLP